MAATQETEYLGFREFKTVKRKLQAIAIRERLTLTQILQRAVAEYIDRHNCQDTEKTEGRN